MICHPFGRVGIGQVGSRRQCCHSVNRDWPNPSFPYLPDDNVITWREERRHIFYPPGERFNSFTLEVVVSLLRERADSLPKVFGLEKPSLGKDGVFQIGLVV